MLRRGAMFRSFRIKSNKALRLIVFDMEGMVRVTRMPPANVTTETPNTTIYPLAFGRLEMRRPEMSGAIKMMKLETMPITERLKCRLCGSV